MPGTINYILGRLGLDRQSKVARKRDLDAAQRLFLQCAQGALGEAGSGNATKPRDPRAALYEKIESRLQAAGVAATSDLPETDVAQFAFQERAVLSGDALFDEFVSSLSNDDRAFARHLRETWQRDLAAFRSAKPES